MIQCQTIKGIIDITLRNSIMEKQVIVLYDTYRGNNEYADKAFIFRIKNSSGETEAIKVRMDEILDIIRVDAPLPEPIIN